MKSYKYDIGFATDTGNIRRQNQDSLLVNKGSIGSDDFALLAVADGMGGLSMGGEASHIAILSLKGWWDSQLPRILNSSHDLDSIDSSLEVTIECINREILSMNGDGEKTSGTTLSLIYLYRNNYIIKHIGDSRIYLIDGKKIMQITKDHTWCAREVEKGNITPDEAENHKMRHVLLNALGTDETFSIQTQKGITKKRNKVLLCTDGFYNYISTNVILEYLFKKESPQIAIDLMMKYVKKTEASDNITAILLNSDTKWTVY